MFYSGFFRAVACLTLSASALSVFCGCTKRLDTSNEDKYYSSYDEVVHSLPASKQKEFDDGMNTIWFYSEDDVATRAMLHGKSGEEILAIIQEKIDSLPKLDTTSREKFESSLKRMRDQAPSSKKKAFDDFAKTLPPYSPGNRRLTELNGLTLQKLVENLDFANGQNPNLQQK